MTLRAPEWIASGFPGSTRRLAITVALCRGLYGLIALVGLRSRESKKKAVFVMKMAVKCPMGI
jgi:hypothetical protein